MKWQGLVGFVVGLIIGGAVMFFLNGTKYEIVTSPHTQGDAWVINKATGEIYSLYVGKSGKPPYK